MPNITPPVDTPPTLHVKLGRVLETRATGWAVLLVPAMLALLLLGAALGVRLS